MPLNIPLDIVETIVDTVAQDDPKHSSTKACSLVSHAFLSICRKHIFATVGLNSERIYSCNGNVEEDLPRVSVHSFNKVLAASPILFHYIRHLKYWIELEDLNDPVLPEMFKQLTRLRSLRILSSSFCHPISWLQVRPVFLNVLSIPSLEELTIGRVTDFIIADLAPCRNLSIFSFAGVIFSATSSGLLPSPLRVHSLLVGAGNSSQISPLWKAQCADGRPFIDLSTLTHLSVVLSTRKEDFENCRLLLRMCKQLISVKITLQGFCYVYDLGKYCFSLLASISTLKHLSIHINAFVVVHRPDLYLGLPHQLERMADKNVIETIAIKVSLMGTASTNLIAEERWEKLDNVLGSSGWPHLRRALLSIIIYCSQSEDSNDNIVKGLKRRSETQFPRLLRKGVKFDFFAQRRDPELNVTES